MFYLENQNLMKLAGLDTDSQSMVVPFHGVNKIYD